MVKKKSGEKEGDWLLTTDDDDNLILTYKNDVLYLFSKEGILISNHDVVVKMANMDMYETLEYHKKEREKKD